MSAPQRVPLWFSALLLLLGLGGIGLVVSYFVLGGGELPLARVPTSAPLPREVGADVPPTPLREVGARSQPSGTTEARRIDGIVRLPDGRPAAGAVVTVSRAETAWPEWRAARLDQAVTGGDGAFAFRLPIEHGVLLAFEHANHAGGLVEAPVPLDRYELHLQSGFTLRGMVTNERGAPIAGATVVVESALADQRRAVTVRTTATGSYTFANLAAGPVRVTASHPWWQPAVAPVVVIGAAPRVDLRFDRPALPPVAGRVVVAATQEPVADALVEFLPAGGRPGLQAAMTARTEVDGTFRIDGIGRGSHRVVVRHAELGAMVRSVVVGPALGELLLELPPRSQISGRLVAGADDGSLPLDGLGLELRDAVGEVAVTTVGAGGAFVFSRALSPGVASLRILRGAAAFARNRSAELAVRIEEDETTQLELPILAPSVVRGRVVDERGRPVAAAWIEQTRVVGENARSVGDAALNLQLFRAGSALADLVTYDRDTLLDVTAADGTFVVRGLPPGFAVLRFQSPGLGGRWLRVTPNPSAGPTELGDVVLVAGVPLRGRVLRGGAPVAGAPVAIFGREMQASAVTRGDGTFVVDDLPPGSYRVRARLPSTAGTTTEVGVELAPGGAAAPIELVMPPGRTLRGIVQGSDGQPVPGALVAVRGSAGPVATDSAGEFAIEVPERAVELQVSPGDRLRETTVAVSATQTRVVVALDTPPTCTLVGSVVGLPGRKRLPGVVARAIDLDGGGADRSVWVDLQNGEFRWPLCPIGRVRIELHAEGHAPATFERLLAAGEIHGFGEVLLEPGAQLRGRVLDVGGEPVVDAAIYLGEEADLDLFDPRTRTDGSGAFVVQGVSTRSDRLVVRARGYAIRSVDLDLPAAVLSPEPLEVRLARGATIEVIVSRPGERDVGIVQLVRDGRVVAGAALDELGRAVFANRSEGRYEVRLLGAKFAARTVQVGAAGGVVRVQL